MRSLLCLLFIAQCTFGAEYEYHPKGAVNGQGLLQEVMSRCPEYGLRQIRGFDKATQAHEATHFVNGVLSESKGESYAAFYVGNGRCYILTPPNLTVGNVAQYVPQERRSATFKQYLTGDRTERNCFSILDEWTCYANDAECTLTMNLPEDGGIGRAEEFSEFADILVQAVQRHDPNYAELKELIEFVSWQRARVASLLVEPKGFFAAGDPQIMDLAPELRELNTDGSCVHVSWANLYRWLGEYDRAEDYRELYSGGESPGPHKRKLDEFGAKYALTTDGDEELLEWAIANRRGAGVTWSPSHCINLIGRENGEAVLMGNGPRGIKEYYRQPWDAFVKEFLAQGGWGFVCLEGVPPPPTPR